MMRIMISIPRASLGLSSPFLLLVGLSGTAIDCLSLVTCPSPFVLLYYPFPLFCRAHRRQVATTSSIFRQAFVELL